MSATVWVGYKEDGYEGCSEPLRVFATKELAEIWKVGAVDLYASGARIKELPVIHAGSALNEEG